MVQISISDIPAGIWVKLILFWYRTKWFFRPLLRFFGIHFRISWDELMFATKLLAPAISRYNPEIIIGAGVGGTVWSAILAGNLSDTPFIGLDREVQWNQGIRNVRMPDLDNLSSTRNENRIKNKRILLVNAEIRSGDTITLMKDHISKLHPTQIKIACIDYSSVAKASPDFAYLLSEHVIEKPWRHLNTYVNPDDGPRPT